MSNCVQCGMTVPDGQRSCSMCYGDIAHGKDGYYRDWAEQRLKEEQEKKERDQQELNSNRQQGVGR